MMITGATGSGKTSILRVLHGLWPSAAGTVERYSTVQPKDVMFLPQKPFLSDGTLREQVFMKLRNVKRGKCQLCKPMERPGEEGGTCI